MGHQCCGSDQQDHEMKDQCCCGDQEDACCDDDHECGCGCDDHESNYVQLTDAEGNEREYRIIGTFDAEEEEFIALLQEDENQVYLFSFVEDGDALQLKQIEDPEKFARVSKIFEGLME